MPTCPRCGSEVEAAGPHPAVPWIVRCRTCRWADWKVEIPDDGVFADGDWPILSVCVVDPGPDRPGMFRLYRDVLGLSPRQAKALLGEARVEVARGCRMDIEDRVNRFRAAGAVLDIARV